MNIAKAISTIRKAKGISIKELEDNTSYNYAIPNPPKEVINEVCKFLDVPVEFILLLGAERRDVPENKKEAYDVLYPVLVDIMMDIIEFPEEDVI